MSDIPSWARVGAKVVCVDARGASELDERGTYTISRIDDGFAIGGIGVWLVEAAPISVRWHNYQGFRLSRFRPLVTLEDDITTYFADLLDVREPVGA